MHGALHQPDTLVHTAVCQPDTPMLRQRQLEMFEKNERKDYNGELATIHTVRTWELFPRARGKALAWGPSKLTCSEIPEEDIQEGSA